MVSRWFHLKSEKMNSIMPRGEGLVLNGDAFFLTKIACITIQVDGEIYTLSAEKIMLVRISKHFPRKFQDCGYSYNHVFVITYSTKL